MGFSDVKMMFGGTCDADSELISSISECRTAFGYEELHLTSDTIKELKHGKDLLVDIQGGEYVLRIIFQKEEK